MKNKNTSSKFVWANFLWVCLFSLSYFLFSSFIFSFSFFFLFFKFICFYFWGVCFYMLEGCSLQHTMNTWPIPRDYSELVITTCKAFVKSYENCSNFEFKSSLICINDAFLSLTTYLPWIKSRTRSVQIVDLGLRTYWKSLHEVSMSKTRLMLAQRAESRARKMQMRIIYDVVENFEHAQNILTARQQARKV